MVPWNKLPKDLQKAILVTVILYGGTQACSNTPPMICDPVPPPTSSPKPNVTPSMTPMICDPVPPPKTTPRPTAAVTPFKTPMICDVPPRPFITPIVPASQHFQVRNVQTSSDASVQGAIVRGVVRDQQGKPIQGLRVTALGQATVQAVTDSRGEYALDIGEVGDYRIMVEGELDYALPLQIKSHDVVNIEWVKISETSQDVLPLAEIRTVDILWDEGLAFEAETPWAEARYRWSASGGTLTGDGERVTWQPPAEPGRYLVQVVADWGQVGLAVDAVTLDVEQDGNVSIVE